MYDAVTESRELKSELRFSLMRVTEELDSNQINRLLNMAKGLTSVSSAEFGAMGNGLSSRELEVLLLLANGYTRRDIGDSLGISINTAARHITNIYRKLDISSVAEATQFAYKLDLI